MAAKPRPPEKSAAPAVLVAHFDAAERERLAALLRSAGAAVETAADGEEALGRTAGRPFAFVLAACMLPKLSGFELGRKLASPDPGTPPTPIVLLSDVDDPYVRARARHVGVKRVVFGTLGELQIQEILATNWSEVDPLSISSRERGGTGDRLVRDILSTEVERDDGSLLAKVSDPLTGLVNAEYLALKVQEEVKRCGRYGQPLALLVAEVHSFDQLVEKHGRSTGDEALLEIAGVFLCESRDVDVAGRVGPARFHLLLPNTPIEGVRALAGRISEGLEGRTLSVEGKEVALTVRIGVAAIPGGTKIAADEFVRQAELDLASAQVSARGRGTNLRHDETPVEPLA